MSECQQLSFEFIAGERRFDLGPLLEYVGGTSSRLRDEVRISGQRFAQWRAEGLSAAEADRAAIAVGTLPELLWPEFFLD